MSRSNPFVFTEQGIYMLMTVLKGDLAIQQSMALIRLFKQLKDYAVSEGFRAPSANKIWQKWEELPYYSTKTRTKAQ